MPPSPIPGKFLVGKKLNVARSPNVAISPSASRAPNAWAQSSTTLSPCSAAIAMIAGMSAGWPKMWTGRIARVAGPIFARTASGSRQYVTGSTSANTGVAPTRAIASAVA